MRATLCVEVDDPRAVALVESWLARWADRLPYLSENQGCGCCVDMWDVEGPAEAIAELPAEVLALTDWSESSPPAPS